jgi:uncharacterized protein (DUF1330 family)
MPAYVIVETDVRDPEQYERYRAAAAAAIAAGGGRYIARGGELAVLEGDWRPKRMVVLEFEDLEAAKRWYDSPEYREARRLREGAATLQAVAVEGLQKQRHAPGQRHGEAGRLPSCCTRPPSPSPGCQPPRPRVTTDASPGTA